MSSLIGITNSSFNTWTEKFPMQRWCIMFSKLQELFNTILILITNGWCFHPTLIHVSHLLRHLIKLSDMHENLTFFIKGMALSHSGRHFLIVDWYVKDNCLFLNLTKLWQHFALASKYTTWKQWHEFHYNQVCSQITKWNALCQNFIKFKKRKLYYMYESIIKKLFFLNCPNGQFNIQYND